MLNNVVTFAPYRGLNVKVFYLIIYSIALRALPLSLLHIHILIRGQKSLRIYNSVMFDKCAIIVIVGYFGRE